MQLMNRYLAADDSPMEGNAGSGFGRGRIQQHQLSQHLSSESKGTISASNLTKLTYERNGDERVGKEDSISSQNLIMTVFEEPKLLQGR